MDGRILFFLILMLLCFDFFPIQTLRKVRYAGYNSTRKVSDPFLESDLVIPKEYNEEKNGQEGSKTFSFAPSFTTRVWTGPASRSGNATVSAVSV